MADIPHTEPRIRSACGQDLEPGMLRTLLGALPLESRLPAALVHEMGLSREESAEVLEVTPEALDRLVRQGLQTLCLLLARRGWERLPHEAASALERLPQPTVPASLERRLQRILHDHTMPSVSDDGAPGNEG